MRLFLDLWLSIWRECKKENFTHCKIKKRPLGKKGEREREREREREKERQREREGER